MRKIKAMMMAIGIVAIVGGALAFKAKINQQICIMNPNIVNPGPNDCPLVDGVTTTNAGPLAKTTDSTLAVDGYCDPAQCNVFTRTTVD